MERVKHSNISRMKGAGALLAVIVAVCIGAVLLYALYGPAIITPPGQNQIKKFSSCDQIKSFVSQSAAGYGGYLGAYTRSMVDITAQKTMTPMAQEADSAGGSEDYSATNVQVAGVDEADIVKNDGKYIYTVSGNSIYILDAYPAESSRLLSQINETGLQNIFVNGDRLVVFGMDYEDYPRPLYENMKASAIASPYYRYSSPKTYVHVYDITDRSNPVLKKNISIEGDYLESRMIGDYVYMIANKNIYYSESEPIVTPLVYSGGQSRPASRCADVYYFGNPDYSYLFTTIASLNVKDDSSDVSSKVIVTGYSETIYVSGSNIYLSYQKSMGQDEYLQRMIGAITPLMPASVSLEIQAAQAGNATFYEKTSKVGIIFQNYMMDLTETQREELTKKAQDAMTELTKRIAKEMEKTVIQKISISDGKIEYATSGEVPGRLLNQFSMDEYNGYLRAATTTGEVWGNEPTTRNHVYVLSDKLSIAGKLEDLAPGERIYSARFIGDKAYLVTFKKTDPLFVISLSDPANPKVLGQLKIPGYSDYLHPYDENHIIGVGKEAVEAEEGDFAWYQGIKLSLFDVSDVERPKEVSKYVIGSRGTDSDALRDHKAFLFSREKNLLVIPVLLAEIDASKYPNGVPDNAHGDFKFQGAYVFDLTLENGFQLKGTAAHTDNETLLKSGYYFYSPYSVKRSLYIGGALYTISDGMVKASSLSDLSEINAIKLPTAQEYYPMLE